MSEGLNIKVISNPDIVMSALATKLDTGQDLTLAETLMASTMTAKIATEKMGPTPADMVLKKPDLPETVKGALASYRGV
ncbi:MAG: hypothetical protein LBR22_00065 [Desulfovibrio sp.]|jgi:hypothetical protein|nr:hypothetical protein [Desulfovibrio sp.]